MTYSVHFVYDMNYDTKYTFCLGYKLWSIVYIFLWYKLWSIVYIFYDINYDILYTFGFCF